ncbi:MAG: phosphoenolpyruvate--protein phosphotransferase [Deltaproteobacteria bacterium]|nr:phosphoenolpyruvate--protein phosphotransferase [Deltaproteobacteria bacterium]
MSPSKSGSTVFAGIGASAGVALGRAYTLDRSRLSFPKYRLPNDDETAREQMRLKTALELSDLQLSEIKAKVAQTEGPEHALILDAHRLMLKDPMLVEEARRLIDEERINAEWAIRRVVKKLKTAFEDIEDDYFRERRADIEFVGDRVVRNLMGHVVDLDPEQGDSIPAGCVVVAHDLSPADATVLMRKGQVAGFVTDVGGQTSHMAIVARAREIPGVVGAGRASELIKRGDLVAIDGQTGQVVVNPTDEQIHQFQEAMRRNLVAEQAMLRIRDLPTVSADQVHLALLGNLEFMEQVPSLLAHGAEGIGLYRTEFLFLERDTPPTEEEHYLAYRSVLEQMGSRPVTIRTLDLGADKVPRGPGARKREREPNPALGLRAVRYCLKNRDVFMAQLCGVLRASVYGNLRVMFPMISGLTELREARAVLERAREELTRQGVPFAPKIPVGIMVETPAAAMAADKLAAECDFFSIGTNDLIQYSMAIDRQNREVAYLYRPLHISILRQIEFTVKAAHAAQIPVAMCGEMAGDPMYTLVLLGLELDALSMVASQIPLVKRIVRNATAEDGRKLLEQMYKLNTAEEIERLVHQEMKARFGDVLG